MHPEALRMGYNIPYFHSELDAWRKIKNCNYKNLTLINYRFKNNGLLGLSKPCELCMMWCTEIFSKIWYTDKNGVMVKL
jgi:hypothetical protein